jgi:AGCS family alanine or glycine:cation symporter
MEQMIVADFVESIASLLRSWPFIILLVGTGVYLTFLLRGIQFRAAKHAFLVAAGKVEKNQDKNGDVSSFQALATMLSGTIGTGNIAGVATAIVAGGPGAVFWMWITAIVGMAIKFCECTLAHHYRELDTKGEVNGGPMFTLKNGLKMRGLGVFFAIFALFASFTTGCIVQANSVIDGIVYIVPAARDQAFLVGGILAVLVGMVVLGGVKRISKVASIVVPFMAIGYWVAGVVILCAQYQAIPAAFWTIFYGAFNPEAIGGGAIGAAIQYGVVRALFASEVGQGTSPMALAPTQTQEPVRAGLLGMIGPYFDALMVSTMTALVIVLSGAWHPSLENGLNGAGLSVHAFRTGLETIGTSYAYIGELVVGLGLMFFAYTTIIVWSYFGSRCINYLFGEKWVLPYRIVFTCAVVLGACDKLEMLWSLADIANILMCIPNLLAVLLLAGTVRKLAHEYEKNHGFGLTKKT